MSTLSLRVTAAERIRMKAEGQIHGHNTLTSYIRWKLGLPPVSAAPDGDLIPDLETVDLEHILPLLVKLTDSTQRIEFNVNRMSKRMGITRIERESEQPKERPKVDVEGFARS